MLGYDLRTSVGCRQRSLVLIAVFWMAFALIGAPAGKAEPVHVTILHTNNVTGHLYPCPT